MEVKAHSVSGNPNVEANNEHGLPSVPGTDMTGICFRDQLWLNMYPLDRNLLFDYFAMSPFYDRTCNNEQLRTCGIHPLDLPHLSQMTGNEYALLTADPPTSEPHLFVLRKQRRDAPDKVTPLLTYYLLDGSIYQAPQLSTVFSARIGRALYHVSKAFGAIASKLEKIGHADKDDDCTGGDAKKGPDLRDVKRVDHILASMQRKILPAPPPPPFPEGYNLLPVAVGDDVADQSVAVDPIIERGPPKRPRLDDPFIQHPQFLPDVH